MKNQLAQQVRRIGVSDPIAAVRRHDYADAFEVRLPEPYPPETWVRAGLDATPGWVDRVVGLLGFSEAPASSSDHVSGFRIVESGPEVVHLETSLPLMHVALVGRNVKPTRRMLTTVVRHERPVISRLVFALIGIGHRWRCRGSSRARSRRADRSGDADTARAQRAKREVDRARSSRRWPSHPGRPQRAHARRVARVGRAGDFPLRLRQPRPRAGGERTRATHAERSITSSRTSRN